MIEAGADIASEPVGARPRFDADGRRLIGGRCRSCSRVLWPRRFLCPDCAEVMVDHVLPRQGLLITWTRAHVPLSGIKSPYVLGLAELGGARVFCHVRTEIDLPVPSPVVVHVDLSAVPPFWVAPDQHQE